MKKLWILGAGQFGQIAAEALRRKYADAEFIMVEKSEAVCRQMANINTTIICGDGIEFLKENLKNPDEPDWIIPVIPVHVAFEWIKAKMPSWWRLEKITIPEPLAILAGPLSVEAFAMMAMWSPAFRAGLASMLTRSTSSAPGLSNNNPNLKGNEPV